MLFDFAGIVRLSIVRVLSYVAVCTVWAKRDCFDNEAVRIRYFYSNDEIFLSKNLHKKERFSPKYRRQNKNLGGM